MSNHGLIHVSDETYITDRDDVSRILLPGADVHVGYDIDRAGSKGRLEVNVLGEHLSANTWLSTYRTVTPEIGPIQRWQRGHWRLGRPGRSSGGAWSMEDGQLVKQSAQGADIINMIAAAGLTEPFYTPVGGVVMADILALLQMATCGDMGPNLLANPGFESGATSWTSVSSGTWTQYFEGAQSGRINLPPPEGLQMSVLVAAASQALNNQRGWQQDVAVPAGTQVAMLSGLFYRSGTAVTRLRLLFYGNGVLISSVSQDYTPTTGVWFRYTQFAALPVGCDTIRVIVSHYYSAAGGATVQVYGMDDIQLRACAQLPLPLSRFNLPQSAASASTRIQTAADKSIGYDAINADRLAAISHYAMSTDYSGRITTSPITALANRQAKYTFGPNDANLLNTDITIPASSEEVYNHWRAIKEDREDGANSMIAHSYNRNPNDEYSIVNTGTRVSAPPIYVQDAINQAALQAAADQARDSYSTKETVTLSTMLLPDLTVYDAIKFEDPALPYLSGLWAVNSIDQGDETMTITATRAIGGGS